MSNLLLMAGGETIDMWLPRRSLGHQGCAFGENSCIRIAFSFHLLLHDHERRLCSLPQALPDVMVRTAELPIRHRTSKTVRKNKFSISYVVCHGYSLQWQKTKILRYWEFREIFSLVSFMLVLIMKTENCFNSILVFK